MRSAVPSVRVVVVATTPRKRKIMIRSPTSPAAEDEDVAEAAMVRVVGAGRPQTLRLGRAWRRRVSLVSRFALLSGPLVRTR